MQGKQRKSPLPQWYSSHITLENPELEELRQQLQKPALTVTIPKPTVCEYSASTLGRVEPNIFYLPSMDNQKAVDSFILRDGKVYIFQFTVAGQQDINDGILTFTKDLGFPDHKDWNFVFFIPPNHTVISPQSHDPTLQLVHRFSAVLDVKVISKKA